MVGQLLQEAFELDGRILRSLKLLFIKPGQLSLEFSANRRADFISPVRLYIFSSLLFFALMSILSDGVPLQPEPGQERRIELDNELQDDTLTKFKERLDPELHTSLQQILSREESWTRAVAVEYMTIAITGDVEISDDWKPFLDRQVIRLLFDPSRAVDDFFEQLPIAAFLFLPVYAGLLKLLYIRSRKYFVEHLVFALHIHALAFLVLTVGLFLPNDQDSWVNLVFMVYYFLALRRYYGQSRTKTTLKYVFLLVAQGSLMLPVILLVMATTFAFY